MYQKFINDKNDESKIIYFDTVVFDYFMQLSKVNVKCVWYMEFVNQR